jgi:hypothetical protein
MPFINFEEVEQLATIEELADMLGLKPSDTMPIRFGAVVPFTAARIRPLLSVPASAPSAEAPEFSSAKKPKAAATESA